MSETNTESNITDKNAKSYSRVSIIIKPTHKCNLSCEYCYVDPNAEKGDMAELTLENMISKFSLSVGRVNYIWHGGEPLIMPIKFYEKAVEFQQRFPGTHSENGFQSNGTLFNEEWADFCQKYGFNIGMSLDGPKSINDLTRHFPDNSSSFDRTLEAAKLAKNRRVGGGLIVVLSRQNIGRLDQIYDFAKSEDIGIKLNPLIKSGGAATGWKDLGIGPHEYGKALTNLFDRWLTDESKVSVSPFDDILGNLLTGEPTGCNYSQTCQKNFISVSPKGNLYPCGRFDGINEFVLGNINTDNVESVLKGRSRILLQQRYTRIAECQPCEYQQICNSGCMHNAFMTSGKIDSKDYYCPSYKMLFSHLKNTLKIELGKASIEKTNYGGDLNVVE